MSLQQAIADTTEAQAAFSKAQLAYVEETNAKAEYIASLKTIKVDAASVKLLVAEFDLPVLVADRMLKEANNDLNAVIQKLLHNQE